MVIVPGGPTTQNIINKEVLEALGPRGILINMARGSMVDEPALIEAMKNKIILSAGLDVFVKEPQVPAELLAMDHNRAFPAPWFRFGAYAQSYGPVGGRQCAGMGTVNRR